MKKRSATADGAFKAKAAIKGKAAPKDWAGLVIAPSVAADRTKLLAQRTAILSARGTFRRWFPWPKDFMVPERQALLGGTKQLDQLIRDWPAAAEHLATVEAQLPEWDFSSIAPELRKRALTFVKGTACPKGADGQPAPADDFRAMVAELAVWPEAVAAVRSAKEISEHIDDLRAGRSLMPRSDRAALEELVRQHRSSMWALSKAADATVVVRDIGPQLREQLLLATQLAVPEKRGVAGPAPQPESQPPAGLKPWFDRARAALSALSSRGDGVVNSVLIALTVAIALWSGLSSFYVGHAWGTWPDILAAVAWGFVTSALATPVLTALRSWGSHPSDAADLKAGA